MPTLEERVDALEQAMAEHLGMLDDLRSAVGGIGETVSGHTLKLDRLIVDMREVKVALKVFSVVQAQHTETLAEILTLVKEKQ